MRLEVPAAKLKFVQNVASGQIDFIETKDRIEGKGSVQVETMVTNTDSRLTASYTLQANSCSCRGE